MLMDRVKGRVNYQRLPVIAVWIQELPKCVRAGH